MPTWLIVRTIGTLEAYVAYNIILKKLINIKKKNATSTFNKQKKPHQNF